jgi:rhodanese-related sulfurtransferase
MSVVLILSVFLLVLVGCQPARATEAPRATPSPPALATPLSPEGPTLPGAEEVADALASPTAAATPVAIPALVKNADGYARVTVSELVELQQHADLFLVHVHFLHEWEIPETDLYLPIDELPARLHELPSPDLLIILYCRSGNVSQSAARFLVEQGYTNVADLRGGYAAWNAAGYPLWDRR